MLYCIKYIHGQMDTDTDPGLGLLGLLSEPNMIYTTMRLKSISNPLLLSVYKQVPNLIIGPNP